MLLPTLLKRGSLEYDYKIQPPVPEIPINFITRFVRDRVYEPIKYSPKSSGDKVMMILGQTGCGKSTILAPHVFDVLSEKYGVILVQPRIITIFDLISNITRLYPKIRLGVNLGYHTGQSRVTPVKKGIMLITTGIFLQYMLHQENILRYGVVIIDEIHERDISLDSALLLLKRFINTAPKCPLFILTSATFDMKKFGDYFNVPKENWVKVTGRAFPIEDNFPDVDVNTDDCLLSSIIKIHETQPVEEKGDIIVFYKSVMSKKIDKLIDEIQKYNSLHQDATILPVKLSSEIFSSSDVQFWKLHAFLEHMKFKRRVIFATPVAEVSLTINHIKYCVDSGLLVHPEFIPSMGVNAIITKAVSKDMAIQRRGRVGRLFSGKWYPCYSKSTFDSMPESQMPHIVIDNLSGTLLQLIGDVPFDPREYDFLDPPSIQSLMFSMETLFSLRFIDADGKITQLGKIAAKFPRLSCHSISLILNGYKYGASIDDLAMIAACIDTGWGMFRNFTNHSDRGTIFDPMKLLEDSSDIKDIVGWAAEKNILLVGFMEALELKSSIIKTARDEGMNVEWGKKWNRGDSVSELSLCVADTFSLYEAECVNGNYRTLHRSLPLDMRGKNGDKIILTSIVYAQNMDGKYVFSSSGGYLRIV